MTREEWSVAQPVLTRALFLSPEEQKAVIESAFVQDSVRRELLDLLRRTVSVLPRPSASPTGSGAPNIEDAVAGSPPFELPGAPLLAPGQSMAGERFSVVRQLGRGGMGEVYLAHDKTLGNLVALKILYDADAREAQHARLCSGHPHIVTMYDAFETTLGDRPRTALVMEYVAGKPASRFVDDGPVALRQAVRWAREVASAMAHAHDRGVLHCDLKPANILITPDEGAKVLDFGIGRATFERANPLERLRGTPPYMAPEQLLEGRFSQTGDIYSLGVTLFELVTGRLPFDGSREEMALQIVAAPSPRASAFVDTVPPQLDEVIARALAKDPNERYRTARALDRALEAVEQELVTTTSPVPAPLLAPIPPPPIRQRAWAYLKAASLILALAAGSGLLTSWTFNLMLDRPRAFDPDSLMRQVMLGFQSMFYPAMVISLMLGLLAGVQFLVTFAFGRRSSEAGHAGMQEVVEGRRTDVAAFLPYAVVIAGVLAVVFVFAQFKDITDALVTRVTDAEPQSVAALHPGNRNPQLLYRLAVPTLLALLVVGWRSVERMATKAGARVPGGIRAAAFTLMIVLFILSQAPYKLLTEHSEVPVVLVENQRCYFLGEANEEARVYCPGVPAPRIRTVRPSTTPIERCGFEENVFVGTIAGGCQPPASSSRSD